MTDVKKFVSKDDRVNNEVLAKAADYLDLELKDKLYLVMYYPENVEGKKEGGKFNMFTNIGTREGCIRALEDLIEAIKNNDERAKPRKTKKEV